MTPREVSTGTAARLEGVSADTIRRRCELGVYPGARYVRPPGLRVGRWRIPRDELLEVQHRENPAKAANPADRGPWNR